jgi:hypothetical protein
MHEVSLGQSIQDYISGQEIESTTYEDLRQAIARLLVEEKGYPKEQLRSKQVIAYEIDAKDFRRAVDIVAYDQDGHPLLVAMFCSGDVSTYVREAVCAGRLVPGGPAKLALVTDTKKAKLIRVDDAQILEEGGYHQLPSWDRLKAMAEESAIYNLSEENKAKMQRLFYTFSELSACCGDSCQ